jgi:uncharacterized protein involved in response to NO
MTSSPPAALHKRRDYSGPALFSYGFRPFFLLGASWAAFGILLWLPQYFGALTLPTAMGALDWHVHEMLFGYVAAVIAGFLLTAVPNWTGRLPVNGAPLMALTALWLAGRAAILVSALTGPLAAAVVDIAFLVALAAVAMREIIAGRNWRHLRVLVLVGLLIAGNAVFHIEVVLRGSADYGIRFSIAAVIALIMLIGGRIVPSFTRNWLVRENPGRLPRPFSRYDGVSLAGSVVALAAWIVAPTHGLTGVLLLAAAVLQAIRLARWAGDRTGRDRLVLVLHVAFAFVPVGFMLVGAAILWPDRVPVSAGVHAWTAGAIGMMTLAVMTRATLGHTGQPLAASAATQVIYALALLAALVRVGASFASSRLPIEVAGTLWCVAFGAFVVVYGPLLVGRQPIWARAK